MVTGVDGKVYPGWTLSAEDRDFIIATCHHLAHDLGYSQRRIKQFFDERGVPPLGWLDRGLPGPTVRKMRRPQARP